MPLVDVFFLVMVSENQVFSLCEEKDHLSWTNAMEGTGSHLTIQMNAATPHQKEAVVGHLRETTMGSWGETVVGHLRETAVGPLTEATTAHQRKREILPIAHHIPHIPHIPHQLVTRVSGVWVWTHGNGQIHK